MAIFGKKRTLDEILKDIDALSPEEKAKVHEKMQDLYKAEDEREVDKIEEDKAETAETADEKAEEVKDESEVIGDDVDTVEDTVEDAEKDTEGEEKPEVIGDDVDTVEDTVEDAEKDTEGEEKPEDVETPVADTKEADATVELLKGITDRLGALEGVVAELNELKDKMNEYVGKQKEAFGYKSDAGTGGDKSIHDMSASELKHKILYD